MDFTINDELITVAQDAISLAQALALKGIHQAKGMAVAINQKIIPQSAWEYHAIQPHDHILIITATQGG